MPSLGQSWAFVEVGASFKRGLAPGAPSTGREE